MSLDLERFRVGTLPSLYYIPEAIGAEEEQRLLREIRASKQAWKTVSGKRQVAQVAAALAMHGGPAGGLMLQAWGQHTLPAVA